MGRCNAGLRQHQLEQVRARALLTNNKYGFHAIEYSRSEYEQHTIQ
jgi:hypothetical protein